MDGIKVTCQCGRILTAPASVVGKKSKCPTCGAHFIIPSPDQAAPAPPLEPPLSPPEAASPAPASRKPFPAKVVAISGGALALVAGLAIAAILHFSDGSGDKTTAENPSTSSPKLNVTETLLGKMVEGFIPTSLVVSPDSKRVAYTVSREGKEFVVIDGVEGKEYDKIKQQTLVFSPDSKRIACVAQSGKKWFVVVDDVKGKEYEYDIDGAIGFSPNSKRVAYVARIISEWYIVVVDGVEERESEEHETFCFSPDSKRVAYTVRWREGEVGFVVVDGVAVKTYDQVHEVRYPEFSPDSKHLAYVADLVLRRQSWPKPEEKEYVVIDGVPGPKYDLVSPPHFSPDSESIYYAAQRGDRTFLVRTFLLHNHVEVAEYDDVGSYDCSPDSKRGAYAAKRGEKWFVVVDGVEGKEYDGIMNYSLVFSPDSKRLAYTAKRGDKIFVVVDGVEGKEYDGTGDGPVFSPDSKRVAYLAKFGEKWFVVVDGIEGTEKEYDGFPTGSSLVFDSPTKFHTLAIRNDEIFLVEIEITK
jgi:hypothetical protein